MATLSIVLVRSNTVSRWGDGPLPVPLSVPTGAQSVTTSGSSAQSSITGSMALSDVWVVTATGGNAWLKFGANPTAAAGSDWLILAGQTREFGVTTDGEKIAYING